MAAGMSRLLHDRYYAYAAEHAWDLATGDSIAIEMSYARVMLSDWQRLETSVRDLLERYRVQP